MSSRWADSRQEMPTVYNERRLTLSFAPASRKSKLFIVPIRFCYWRGCVEVANNSGASDFGRAFELPLRFEKRRIIRVGLQALVFEDRRRRNLANHPVGWMAQRKAQNHQYSCGFSHPSSFPSGGNFFPFQRYVLIKNPGCSIESPWVRSWQSQRQLCRRNLGLPTQ